MNILSFVKAARVYIDVFLQITDIKYVMIKIIYGLPHRFVLGLNVSN